MKITIAQLRILLAVVRTGSIGAAARQLGLTQSGTSQAIIALEKALGIELVVRTQGGVSPTAFALSILEDARIATDAVHRIADRARAEAPVQGGLLRVASVPSIAARHMPAWSRSFRRLYPEVELSIFEGNHIEIGEWVRDGVADLGLTAFVPAGLGAEHAWEEELVLVAPRGHSILRRDRVSVADLSDVTLVTAGHGCDPILERLFASAAQLKPRTIRAQDIATALAMVRHGLGLTILPEAALPRTDVPDLRTRPLSPHAHRHIYMVTLPERASQAAVSRFLNLVREFRQGAPGHQQH